jgi:anaerobic selenocysteine-containing dehydrogenase
MEVHNTACPRNCYSTCSFKVWTEEGKVVKIDPEPLNKATPEGPCLKGLSYLERVNSRDRILYPLKKTQEGFERISWDDALQLISRKLLHFKKEFGSKSVLFYAASGMSGVLNGVSTGFWKMYGGATTVYGNLCWPAGLEATRLTLGENKHNAPWDLENAGVIVLWGKNPAETNIQQMMPIRKAQENGARVIVVDPRYTPSAQKADLLVQPIPGTDGLLALSIAKILIEQDNVDLDFIKKYVLGYDAFKQEVLKIDLSESERICGVPVSFMEEMARSIAAEVPMTLVVGYGMQRYSNGGQTTRCLLALSVITGNIGKPGACWHYADLQGDIFSEVKEPESYYPDKRTDGVFRRSISTALLGEQMLTQRDPELKMAWVERGNPITQNPDSNKVVEAFRNLDFVVVVDQFLTDTALEADIVLPAKSMFEQTDIISSYWNPYVQLRPKVIEPMGEVKPETEIYYHLAQAMGFPQEIIGQHIPPPDDEAIDQWLEDKLKSFPGLSLEKLKRGPVLAPGLQEVAFSDFKFPTPSGKIELYSEVAAKNWDVPPLPTYEPVKEGKQNSPEFPYALLSPNTKNRIHSQFGNLQVIKSAAPEVYATISALDARQKGIRNGNKIRVFNDRGSLVIKAKTDQWLRPGCIVIYNGYWHQEGACPNVLSRGRETDMGYGTAFHDNMVDYEKV